MNNFYAMNFLAVIPARYASSRMPAKPLALINQKPMVMWVYDAVKASNLFDEVFVATDDQRIFDTVLHYKGKALMTSTSCSNGTQRCAQVMDILASEGKKFDVIVNIQGDEPLINKESIEGVVNGFQTSEADIVTLKKSISSLSELTDKNTVKVVTDNKGRALYFSRSVIPCAREDNYDFLIKENLFYKHIGIYGYRAEVLKQIVQLNSTSLENCEKLEQLRWLENGYNIMVKTTLWDTVGVDTPEDLNRVIKIINKQ